MTTNQAYAFEVINQKLAKENENIQEAFQQMKYDHEHGAHQIQKNSYGKKINKNFILIETTEKKKNLSQLKIFLDLIY